jgi:hypothetical protein
METNIISELTTFIEHAPTAFHAVAELKEILKQEGFEELKESEKWKIKPGKRYYVTRNNSSIIAVKAGKEILAKADATQEEANAAANAIADSMQALMERADIRSLRELTDAANELLEKNSGKYTDDTAKALQDAVAHAEEILGKDGKSDAEINEAYNQIMDAIVGLKMKGNKAALEAMIKKAESILAENSRYVAATIEGLDEELAAAKAVYENNQALQSEVNEAVKSLTFKIAEARLLGDVDGDGQITTNDTVEILRAAAEIATLSAEDAASADVNGDGMADTADAVLVLQYASEAVSGF